MLKLETKEFNSLMRSFTPPTPPRSYEEFIEIGLRLCKRVGLEPKQLYRLVGIGLSAFEMDDETGQESESLLSGLM